MQCSRRFLCGLALTMSVSLYVAPRALAPDLAGTQSPAAAVRATLPWHQAPGPAHTEKITNHAGAVQRNSKLVRTSPDPIPPGQLDESIGDPDDVVDSPDWYSETPLDAEWSDNALWGDNAAWGDSLPAANGSTIVLSGEN
jgi:hypothetical protein